MLSMYRFFSKYFEIKEMASLRTQNLAYAKEVYQKQLGLYCELCEEVGLSNFRDKIIGRAYKYTEELNSYIHCLEEDIISEFAFCASNFMDFYTDSYQIVKKYLRKGNKNLAIYKEIEKRIEDFN